MKPRYGQKCAQCHFLGSHKDWDLFICPSCGIYGKGYNVTLTYDPSSRYAKDEFGYYPLAKAIALAKRKNLYKDAQEKMLLPEFDKPLWVVIGRTGSGEHQHFWLVRSFRDKQTAELYAEACKKKASVWSSNTHPSPPFAWSLLDPHMQIDESVTYYVRECPIAPRLEDISSHWEMCPVCRGQMYDTPEGRICENGHEALS